MSSGYKPYVVYLNRCVGPLLLVVGTCGNVLAAVVVVRSKVLWKNTTSLYILVLAIVDTLTLNFHMIQKIIYFKNGFSVTTSSAGLAGCRIYAYVYHVLPELEAWILVNMALERTVAVFAPLKISILFTKRRALLGLFINSIFIFSVNAVWFCTLVPQHYIFCDINEGITLNDMTAYYIVHFTMGSAIPFLILAVSGAALVLKVAYGNKRRSLLGINRKTLVSRMTLIMIALSVAFLVFTAPATIIIILLCFGFFIPPVGLFVSDFVFHFNYIVNFYI